MKLGELKENINQKQAGASLIETLVAFGLLSIIAVAFLSGLATSLTGTLTAKEQATAESLARGELDFIKSSSYGSTTSTQARTATGAFSDIISGLSSDTTYHYRAVASGDGTAYGADRTFTTPTSPPQLSSGATFGLDGGDSVDQSAWFNMQRFENTAGTGTLSKLEVLISDSAPSGNIRLGVYADNNRVPGGLLLDAGEVALKNGWVDISGLSLPVTDGEYYWLAYVPRNRVGIVYQSTAMPADSHLAYQYAYGPLPGTPGAGSVNDTTFVMRATVSATPPSVATGAAGSITTSGATLNGSLTDLGTASSVGVKFEYGLTSGYGSTTSIQARTATGAFSDIISGLSSSTPYHYRAVAVGDGTSYGTDRTFTTAAPAPPSVTTEDTFGLDGGDSVDQSAWFNMQRFENTAGTGTLNKLEVLISDSAPSGNIRLGVYADNNGVPGEFLRDAGEVSMKDGWTGISGLSLPVTAGEYYWLAYVPQNRVGIVYQSTGMPADSHLAYQYTYGPLPGTPGSGSVNDTPFVMRATVDVSTGASALPSVTTGVFGLSSGDSVDKSAWFNMQRFGNTAGTGTLNKLEVLISDSAPSGNIRLGVYADNNGVPGELLLDAGEVSMKDGWTGISGLSLPVTAGEYYWLAYLPEKRVGVVYQSTGMPDGSHNCYAYRYGPLPDTPQVKSVNNTPFVMRATVNVY